MRSITIVLAENDVGVAQVLSASLDPHFRRIQVVHSLDELKAVLSRQRADAAIVDLETIGLWQVRNFRREFQLPVVCTHRVPDDEIWTAAMDAGAADVCERTDIAGILRAIKHAGAVAA